MRAQHLGKQIVFETQPIITFNSTEIGNIDEAGSNATVSPYARNNAAEPDNENATFQVLGGITLAALQKVCFGVFLLPDYVRNKIDGNLLINGALNAKTGNTTHKCYPILGRLASGTIVSSKAAVSNTITDYIILPALTTPLSGAATGSVHSGFWHQVYHRIDKTNDTGYPIVLGYVFENVSASNSTVDIFCSLSIETPVGDKAHDPMRN